MSKVVSNAIKHWGYVAPLLTPPKNDAEYEALVEALDEILDAGGADELYPLAGLADHIGELIARYEERRHLVPDVRGADMLRFLMESHGLKQSDLPEVGTQSVVSEILSGKRQLNARQIARLSARFRVPADVFLP